MSEFEFTFPNLSVISVPFGFLIGAIIIMIGIIIYLAKNELRTKTDRE